MVVFSPTALIRTTDSQSSQRPPHSKPLGLTSRSFYSHSAHCALVEAVHKRLGHSASWSEGSAPRSPLLSPGLSLLWSVVIWVHTQMIHRALWPLGLQLPLFQIPCSPSCLRHVFLQSYPRFILPDNCHTSITLHSLTITSYHSAQSLKCSSVKSTVTIIWSQKKSFIDLT